MTTETTVKTNSAIIEGFEGRTRVWPGKEILYSPTFSGPVLAQVVRITKTRIVIKVVEGASKDKVLTVTHRHVCSNTFLG